MSIFVFTYLVVRVKWGQMFFSITRRDVFARILFVIQHHNKQQQQQQPDPLHHLHKYLNTGALDFMTNMKKKKFSSSSSRTGLVCCLSSSAIWWFYKAVHNCSRVSRMFGKKETRKPGSLPSTPVNNVNNVTSGLVSREYTANTTLHNITSGSFCGFYYSVIIQS